MPLAESIWLRIRLAHSTIGCLAALLALAKHADDAIANAARLRSWGLCRRLMTDVLGR